MTKHKQETDAAHRKKQMSPDAVVAGCLDGLGGAELVEAINGLRAAIHERSPFSTEPVDFVRWVPAESVTANDYNPNAVAPPEMQLLELSIESDGFTQPIVAWGKDGEYEVIDGFHRNRVGRESPSVSRRINGYLPLAVIKDSREGRSDRMASTIRHNRARGKHRVGAMSDIVVELKRRNWSDKKVAKELGMDADEVLRLTQISGMAELFSDDDFSEAWDIGGDLDDADEAVFADEL